MKLLTLYKTYDCLSSDVVRRNNNLHAITRPTASNTPEHPFPDEFHVDGPENNQSASQYAGYDRSEDRNCFPVYAVSPSMSGNSWTWIVDRRGCYTLEP